MKRFVALVLVLLCFLAGCANETFSAQQAKELALSEMGRTESEVDEIHSHVITYEGKPCYQIHITIGGSEYEYTISSDGDILHADILS